MTIQLVRLVTRRVCWVSPPTMDSGWNNFTNRTIVSRDPSTLWIKKWLIVPTHLKYPFFPQIHSPSHSLWHSLLSRNILTSRRVTNRIFPIFWHFLNVSLRSVNIQLANIQASMISTGDLNVDGAWWIIRKITSNLLLEKTALTLKLVHFPVLILPRGIDPVSILVYFGFW